MTTPAPYRVLARKYRPQRFSELIGQEPMVRTLGNAIKRDRLAHAFLMTGVRGVGKTSTARLIAKALNCIGPDGQGGPTIDPCGVCEPCVAIADGRYIDVIEMDAASNTKVEQMRDLLDNVPYAAVSARYKIYIIDEVHMLSNSSFNALLKTLEEPPAHVKFLFATTEVQKVPLTVLSRCQRFDLKRISAEMLANHFAGIAKAESVDIEAQALVMIARAAEGSVRDGLSILDQAIAHADLEASDGNAGQVTAAAVRDMLGLSDRNALRDLFDLLLRGEAPAALAKLSEQVDLGVDPTGVLRGLLEIVHGVTLVKAGAAPDAAQSAEERAAADRWADGMSFATLHRLWQLLLKGHDEVARASDPHQAADMALLRVIHASQMPDPAGLLKRIEAGGVAAPLATAAPAAPSGPATYQALVELVEASGKRVLAHRLQEETSVARWAPPEIGLHLRRPFELRELAAAFREVTGTDWIVTSEEAASAPSLREQEVAAENSARDAVLADPVVAAALAAFPSAELLEISEQRSAIR
ncbi:DNA polymerase III subunit gamma/tau [Sphingomonas sp. SUN039]|uniref:DNA polymerase III subunit gamma/tau n=1 Tax=Sphingomonas sp. SUN039 TaxID=2937787 RepID=UPI002164B61A|nr:DNA polymerase III subunit gamma/tau [Sphingomonas sp. SUN039]UVO53854.1 DNA polymerase III subunit gamma/tau [Sphingomonas sp. SUN039]